MVINPNMAELREELSKAGIEYETDDAEGWVDVDEYTEVFAHHEQTDLIARDGRIVTVAYHWDRDSDGRKRGRTLGWPAYMEVTTDEHEPRVMDVWEVLEEASM